MKNFPHSIILIPAIALVIAVLPLPYGYYTLLRLLITAFAVFLAYVEYDKQKTLTGWATGFIAVALLFNPLVPIHLSRSSWFFLDLISAGLFGAYWSF